MLIESVFEMKSLTAHNLSEEIGISGDVLRDFFQIIPTPPHPQTRSEFSFNLLLERPKPS